MGPPQPSRMAKEREREGKMVGRQSHKLAQNKYLVDPASSHMLVLKIKPCMPKYKLLLMVKLRTAP